MNRGCLFIFVLMWYRVFIDINAYMHINNEDNLNNTVYAQQKAVNLHFRLRII